MEQKRIYYWDNLKGLLIISVVLGHLLECYIHDSHLLPRLWILIYSFHMPLFVFISGYFAQKSSRPAEHHIRKMFFLYLLMQVLFTVFNYFTVPDYNLLFLLASPEFGCWYLLFMVYAYILVKYLQGKEEHLLHYIVTALIVSLLSGFDESIGHDWTVGRALYFLPYFLTGYFAAAKKIKLADIRQDYAKISVPLSLAVIVAIPFIYIRLYSTGIFNRVSLSGKTAYESLYPDNHLYGLLFRILVYGFSALMALAVMTLMTHKKCILSFIGKQSLLIYLVHVLMLRAGFTFLGNMSFAESRRLNSCIILILLAAWIIFWCLLAGLAVKGFKSRRRTG